MKSRWEKKNNKDLSTKKVINPLWGYRLLCNFRLCDDSVWSSNIIWTVQGIWRGKDNNRSYKKSRCFCSWGCRLLLGWWAFLCSYLFIFLLLPIFKVSIYKKKKFDFDFIVFFSAKVIAELSKYEHLIKAGVSLHPVWVTVDAWYHRYGFQYLNVPQLYISFTRVFICIFQLKVSFEIHHLPRVTIGWGFFSTFFPFPWGQKKFFCYLRANSLNFLITLL